jgi:hypothetical protein
MKTMDPNYDFGNITNDNSWNRYVVVWHGACIGAKKIRIVFVCMHLLVLLEIHLVNFIIWVTDG